MLVGKHIRMCVFLSMKLQKLSISYIMLSHVQYPLHSSLRVLAKCFRIPLILLHTAYSYPLTTEVFCGSLPDPPNGGVEVTGSGPGDQANYSCSEGFQLTGEATRLCTASGEWSGQEIECKGT